MKYPPEELIKLLPGEWIPANKIKYYAFYDTRNFAFCIIDPAPSVIYGERVPSVYFVMDIQSIVDFGDYSFTPGNTISDCSIEQIKKLFKFHTKLKNFT